jgi:hypothetical protein
MTTNKYTYEYDDCGVMCRYNAELSEWECCECHCVDCGYLPEECECDAGFKEANYIKDELKLSTNECHIKPMNDKVISTEEEEDEENKEKLICSYCGRDEEECEKNTESEKNPVTNWMGGWGISCDDCYYKNNADTDEESGDEK